MLEFVEGDVLSSTADAIVLTIDGAKKGMEGNIARSYARRWPDAWMEIEDAIRYPVSLGRCVAVAPKNESQFRWVLLASTLHHLDFLTDAQKAGVIRAALGDAIKLALRHRVGRLATAVMTGGWRMELKPALAAMLDILRPITPQLHALTVSIYTLTPGQANLGIQMIKQQFGEMHDPEPCPMRCEPERPAYFQPGMSPKRGR